jgi:uncharacterized repeat protein (TIGR03803 family)
MTKTVQSPGTRRCAANVALGLAIALLAVGFATASGQKKTFTVLHAFTGGADGGNPYAGLIRDATGNVYGTTYYGGTSGYGTVFMLDKTGKERAPYSFTGGSDGANPYAGLVRDASGNLYGTTFHGGSSACSNGCGVVFKVDKAGKETVLYSFTGSGGDGAYPVAGLLRDAKGNLYGTTYQGGASGYGTVFMLDTTGKETVLFSFTERGGIFPYAGLVQDAAGNLYGTTSGGGNYYGVVYKLDETGEETVLYKFRGGQDGRDPQYGYLVRDAAGNLYGTTQYGGTNNFYGMVFMLDETGKEFALYNFSGGNDGAYPEAGLVRDAAGNLYGTTEGGGASGSGTVFMLDHTGKETVLHSFKYSTDGGYPYAGLVRDGNGNLYGTTLDGGDYGYGTVFKVTP